MSLINEKLKNIELKELCIIIISLFFIYCLVNSFTGVYVSSSWIYFFLILYFIYKLRNAFSDFKNDFLEVFTKESLKSIFLIVLLNIFISYGMLYLSYYILEIFPQINLLINFRLSSIYLNNSLIFIGSFIATILISPISEELIFRGVLLNKLLAFLPTIIAISITSLVFASLHPFGSIISAFVFAFCMAILYLKSQNIFVPIFAHFLNNFLAESIRFMDRGNLIFNNETLVFLMSIMAVISLIVIIYSISKELNNIK